MCVDVLSPFLTEVCQVLDGKGLGFCAADALDKAIWMFQLFFINVAEKKKTNLPWLVISRGRDKSYGSLAGAQSFVVEGCVTEWSVISRWLTGVS